MTPPVSFHLSCLALYTYFTRVDKSSELEATDSIAELLEKVARSGELAMVGSSLEELENEAAGGLAVLRDVWRDPRDANTFWDWRRKYPVT